jgi:pantoate--beta-alanine ligase
MEHGMQIVESVREMQKLSDAMRNQGKRISFVPTMGYLHRGHLSLIDEARRIADRVVTSIYVNPTQFGPNEDLTKYPRTFASDQELCRQAGVDVLFTPTDSEMYPLHYQTYITVESVTNNLCGLSRPTHFRGVATICAKLFNMVKPHVAVFGKKDFQQLTVIKRMVTDLNLDLEIIGMPTVRDEDGLAMSSRNIYLKDVERESALSLSRSLKLAKILYDTGERDAEIIIFQTRSFIESQPYAKIDYIKICDTTELKDVKRMDNLNCVMALAVKVGLARLIDNYVFGETLNI